MARTTTGLIKGYTATAVVAPRRIVSFGAADGAVVQSAAATNFHIGVSSDIQAEIGERCDVFMSGNIADIEYGATIVRGASVTSDANGRAVTATVGQRAIGYAEISGVNLDIGSIIVAPHTAA